MVRAERHLNDRQQPLQQYGGLVLVWKRHHLGARDKSRADVTLTRLRERGRRLSCAELTRVADMTRVAAQIASQEPRIDVLIAGALFATRQVTLCAEARNA